ncbi:MAG: hypothetical protein R2867_25010 [Caldilineaceae bacterium]
MFTLEEVVRKGDSANEDIFAPQTLLMPSSVGITSELRRNARLATMALVTLIPTTKKMIAVAIDADSPYVLPSVASGRTAAIRLRADFTCILPASQQGIIGDYLDWIMGSEGQTIVAELGFVPLPK